MSLRRNSFSSAEWIETMDELRDSHKILFSLEWTLVRLTKKHLFMNWCHPWGQSLDEYSWEETRQLPVVRRTAKVGSSGMTLLSYSPKITAKMTTTRDDIESSWRDTCLDNMSVKVSRQLHWMKEFWRLKRKELQTRRWQFLAKIN